MARWRWFEGNLGINAWFFGTENYDLVRQTRTGFTLEYNSDLGGEFDATRYPTTIRVNIEEGALRDGRYVAGTVSDIRLLDADDQRLIQINQINLPILPAQVWYEDRGDFDNFFRLILSQDSVYLGADNTAERDHDEIRTGAGNDTVSAGSGDDQIRDLGGQDRYDGGSGKADELIYDEWFFNPTGVIRGIDANLKTGRVIGPDGLIDLVENIERIDGTFLDDRFIGDAENNRFRGFSGNDTLNGGGGQDRADYSNADNRGGFMGIDANLGKGLVRDSYGSEDLLRSIEDLSGSDFDDIIRDSAKNNFIEGGDGNDTISAGAGDDVLRGGTGADLFILRGRKFGEDIIDDFDSEQGDRIEILAARRFSQLEIIFDASSGDSVVSFGQGTVIFHNAEITRDDLMF